MPTPKHPAHAPEAYVPRPGDRARASVLVRAPQALAFATFVDDIDRWWRRGLAYRIARGSAGVLHLERGVGGRLFETIEASDSSAERTVQTGRVLVWEPPARLVFEWRGVTFEGDEKTEVEVCFEDRSLGRDDDEPRTYVTVTHSGFAALRPDHPVRHGKDDVAFVRDLATWWGSLLSAFRSFREESVS